MSEPERVVNEGIRSGWKVDSGAFARGVRFGGGESDCAGREIDIGPCDVPIAVELPICTLSHAQAGAIGEAKGSCDVCCFLFGADKGWVHIEGPHHVA